MAQARLPVTPWPAYASRRLVIVLMNTDPRNAPFNNLASTRTIYFEEPGKTDGPGRAAAVASPFEFTVSSQP